LLPFGAIFTIRPTVLGSNPGGGGSSDGAFSRSSETYTLPHQSTATPVGASSPEITRFTLPE